MSSLCVMLYYVMLCYFMLCYVMLCYCTLCYVMLRNVTLCFVILRYFYVMVMLFVVIVKLLHYAMLYDVTLFCRRHF
jgi:hypothetical protein